MRKPRPLRFRLEAGGSIEIAWCDYQDRERWVFVDFIGMGESAEPERLAAWLLKAAQWIREKETER